MVLISDHAANIHVLINYITPPIVFATKPGSQDDARLGFVSIKINFIELKSSSLEVL